MPTKSNVKDNTAMEAGFGTLKFVFATGFLLYALQWLFKEANK